MADREKTETAPPQKRRLWLWLGVGIVLLVGALAGGYHFLFQGETGAKHPVPPPPVHFISLQPFVSNLSSNSGLHYIQVTIKLKTRDPNADAKVNDHLPEIRNAVLSVLASQSVTDMVSSAGRSRLRSQILCVVNFMLRTGVMKTRPRCARAGIAVSTSAGTSALIAGSVVVAKPKDSPILGVYFTAFIVQ